MNDSSRASARPLRRTARSSLYLAVLVAAAILSGCAVVDLGETPAPVVDRAAPAVVPAPMPAPAPAPLPTPAAPAPAEQRAVVPVQAPTPPVVQPPTQLARLVFFDFDEYVIRPEFVPLLEGHARFLNANRQRRVALEGHTDERGGREYNLALGNRRAQAVRSALALLGVQDAQMEAVSFGEEKPANPGSDEAAHAQNRRVELVYR